MSDRKSSLRVVGPTITTEAINQLPDYVSLREQQLNIKSATALFGLLVRNVPSTLERTDGHRLTEGINANIMIPNVERRDRLRSEGKLFRDPITSFIIRESLDLTFFGKRPASETIWWTIQHGIDPRLALELHTYSYDNGAEVHVADTSAGVKGAMILGLADEKQKVLSCAIVEDRISDEPTLTLKLLKPMGFHHETSVAKPGRARGASPSLGPAE